jgi:hypothetical protein
VFSKRRATQATDDRLLWVDLTCSRRRPGMAAICAQRPICDLLFARQSAPLEVPVADGSIGPASAGVLILIMPRLLSYIVAAFLIISFWAWGFSIDGLNQPGRPPTKTVMTLVAVLSAAICVTMFALGFGVLIPISGALSSLADLVGVASAMVVLGLLFG